MNLARLNKHINNIIDVCATVHLLFIKNKQIIYLILCFGALFLIYLFIKFIYQQNIVVEY